MCCIIDVVRYEFISLWVDCFVFVKIYGWVFFVWCFLRMGVDVELLKNIVCEMCVDFIFDELVSLNMWLLCVVWFGWVVCGFVDRFCWLLVEINVDGVLVVFWWLVDYFFFDNGLLIWNW